VLAAYEEGLHDTKEETTPPKQPEQRPASTSKKDKTKRKDHVRLCPPPEVQDPLKQLKQLQVPAAKKTHRKTKQKRW
jgi:hypothetical protein